MIGSKKNRRIELILDREALGTDANLPDAKSRLFNKLNKAKELGPMSRVDLFNDELVRFKVFEEYSGGKKPPELANKYGVSEVLISDIIKEFRGTMRMDEKRIKEWRRRFDKKTPRPGGAESIATRTAIIQSKEYLDKIVKELKESEKLRKFSPEVYDNTELLKNALDKIKPGFSIYLYSPHWDYIKKRMKE